MLHIIVFEGLELERLLNLKIIYFNKIEFQVQVSVTLHFPRNLDGGKWNFKMESF